MGEGGWWCGVGCRPLVSVAGYCLPSSGHLHIVGVLGASVVQLITSRVVRPDRPDPTETEPVALVRSLRPSCWRSDVIGSYLVAHVEELPRHLGRGVWRVVVRVCRSRWAFLTIARRSPLSRQSKRPPAIAEGLCMSDSSPLVGVVLLG